MMCELSQSKLSLEGAEARPSRCRRSPILAGIPIGYIVYCDFQFTGGHVT